MTATSMAFELPSRTRAMSQSRLPVPSDLRSTSTVTDPSSSTTSASTTAPSTEPPSPSTPSTPSTPRMSDASPRQASLKLPMSSRTLPRCAVVNFHREGETLRWQPRVSHSGSGLPARVHNFEDAFSLEEFSSTTLPVVWRATGGNPRLSSSMACSLDEVGSQGCMLGLGPERSQEEDVEDGSLMEDVCGTRGRFRRESTITRDSMIRCSSTTAEQRSQSPAITRLHVPRSQPPAPSPPPRPSETIQKLPTVARASGAHRGCNSGIGSEQVRKVQGAPERGTGRSPSTVVTSGGMQGRAWSATRTAMTLASEPRTSVWTLLTQMRGYRRHAVRGRQRGEDGREEVERRGFLRRLKRAVERRGRKDVLVSGETVVVVDKGERREMEEEGERVVRMGSRWKRKGGGGGAGRRGEKEDQYVRFMSSVE